MSTSYTCWLPSRGEYMKEVKSIKCGETRWMHLRPAVGLTSVVVSHTDSISTNRMWSTEHLTSAGFLKTPVHHSNHYKNIPQIKWSFILHNIWPVTLKTEQVIKQQGCESSERPKETRQMNDAAAWMNPGKENRH